MKLFFKFLYIPIFIFLTGCVEAIVVGTIATGAYVVSDGDFFDFTEDSKIKSSIEEKFKNSSNAKNLENINIEVISQRVLLTGYVNNSQYKTLATREARSVKLGIEVIDEISILGSGASLPTMNDSFIETQVSLKLKATSGIKSGNYKYDVVNGRVFIIGTSLSNEELRKTTSIISQIKGVKEVISYIVVYQI